MSYSTLFTKIFAFTIILCIGCIFLLFRDNQFINNLNANRIQRIESPKIILNELLDTCSLEDYNNSILRRGSFKNEFDLGEYEMSYIERKFSKFNIDFGGRYSPKNCIPEQKIAIIISYRNRLENLKSFLLNMYPYFINQNLAFGVYLVEPREKLTWNKGPLYNIGFIESLRDSENLWDCFFFHDIDMLPEDLRNIYKCDYDMPVHYSVAVSKYNYTTTGYFERYYGGVNAVTKSQFIAVNGCSNDIFGWGGQDDDFYNRCKHVYKKIKKRPADINRYFSMPHGTHGYFYNPNVNGLLDKLFIEYNTTGIRTGLNTTFYQLVDIKKFPLYTHMIVNFEDMKPGQ